MSKIIYSVSGLINKVCALHLVQCHDQREDRLTMTLNEDSDIEVEI